MIQYRAISAPEMAALRKSGITDQHLTNALSFLSIEKWTSPLNKLNVMFYIDRFGDFTSSKTKTAQIVNALYKSLDKPDQMAVMSYLMEHEDD